MLFKETKLILDCFHIQVILQCLANMKYES